jgi:hypothetical protein
MKNLTRQPFFALPTVFAWDSTALRRMLPFEARSP